MKGAGNDLLMKMDENKRHASQRPVSVYKNSI
nr:MAG TPA: hypothetical protein [Bacteriophage sp.]DAU54616.1 MAG TPA: hypothetical protein [Caudoviricetes sp.]